MILRSSIPSMAEGSRAPRAAVGRGITDSPVRWRRTCSSVAPRLIEIKLGNSNVYGAHIPDVWTLENWSSLATWAASVHHMGLPSSRDGVHVCFFFFLTNTAYIQYNNIYTTVGQVCRVCRCIPSIPYGYATDCNAT